MGAGIQTSITSIPVFYFAVASVAVALRSKPAKEPSSTEDAKTTEEPQPSEDSKPPEDQEKEPRLKKSLLGAVAITIAISIAESASQAAYIGGFSKEADDKLLADLLFIFIWTVLGLSLIYTKLTIAHYGTFALSIIVRLWVLLKNLDASSCCYKRSELGKAVVSLTGFQLLSVIVTCAIAITSSLLGPKSRDSNPETQPLLTDESNDESRKKKNESPKEETEDDKARKALRNRSTMQYLKAFSIFIPFMWPSTTRQKAHVTGMVICSALKRVIGILQPLTLGAVVNDLAQAWTVPWKSISVFIVLRALDSNIGISLIEDMLYMYLQNQQELAMKRAAYDHILNLSASFHDSKTTSHVWQAMYHARSAIALCHDAAFSIGPSVIDLVAGFIVLYALFGDYMGLLVLSTVVMFLWMTASALSPRADLYRKYEDCWHEETFQMLDSTSNWYTVAEFNQIPYEKDQFRAKGKASQNIVIKIWWYNRRSSIARYTLMTLGFTAACCLAAIQIANHEQKVGAFVTLTSYWAQLTMPLGQLVNEINSASEKLVRAEKLVVLLEKKPEIQEPEDAKPYSYQGGAVEFENVHFTYDGKRQASESITFRAAPGSMTALVGETGGGKSTILKLLFRFYDPQEGRVLIDGQDLKCLQLSSFRKHIGWVPQDAAPFNKTILDNVRYSDIEIDESAVEDACKDAALHDKIMTFTKKYQEKVGERGTKLSGGERQRLAIARAILKKPDILLLDEATSSVDSLTEAQIQASLDNLGRTKTTFVIAHRLSTILKADQILVIEKGKLVQSGHHADLIKQDGTYRKLWESQLRLQAEMGEKSNSTSGGPEKTVLKLIDDVTESNDNEGTDGETAKRGRKADKVALESLQRRMSSSRSSRRISAQLDGESKTNGDVQASTSPSRSQLKPDAPDFVPRNVPDSQKDGTADLLPRSTSKDVLDSTHDRRQTKSEPAPNETDDSEASNKDSSEEDEGNDPKYSRIPKRNQ